MNDTEKNFITDNIDFFCCPRCSGELQYSGNNFNCLKCGQSFPVVDSIPMLYWPNEWDRTIGDVTEEIKSFYEENPFPNYDEFDSVESLIDKARKGLFAKLLDDQILYNANILECGCGTGQMTNFLSIANRTIIGTDICMNSLNLAHKFKNSNNLDDAHFYQMNLFRPCFKPNTFDLVIANGVLHHTSNPFLAFKSISTLVKPNGYILIGLYHKYGRLITNFRRIIFRITKDKFQFMDPRTVNKDINQTVRKSWFMDQYKNPHESRHTIKEVLNWLDKTGFTFIHSIPKTVPFTNINESEKLFKQERLGNWFERLFVNIEMIFKGHKEGGLFIIIARKS
ncbi:MAG: class I SAM-dependent methyltransferase [Ignavibacteriales bacterium]|nr:class I SAM-dependent methyltransferase [Ignavibacteriales bacterium]